MARDLDDDDMLLAASVRGRELTDDRRGAARDAFFAKPRPCFRASPRGRTLGGGVHADDRGRIALDGVETGEYARLAARPALAQTRAMRSKRAR